MQNDLENNDNNLDPSERESIDSVKKIASALQEGEQRQEKIKYVAYLPSWIEKIVIILLVIMTVIASSFLLFGSNPARQAQQDADDIIELLCNSDPFLMGMDREFVLERCP